MQTQGERPVTGAEVAELDAIGLHSLDRSRF